MEYPAKIVVILAGLALTAAGPLFGQSDRSLLRDGNRLYESGKFADAEVNYRKSLEKNKESLHGPFNLGDALYRQDRFDEAADQYKSAAAKATDPTVKAEALHNLGNTMLKAQKYPESIASYKEALKLNPKDAETKYNMEYAKAMLKKQQEQQQKQQQKQDQKKDDKKKDDKKNDDQNKDQQKQDQQKQQDQKQPQKKQEISKADAERILEALRNEEKNVKKKLQKKAPAQVKVEKDW